MIDIQIDLNLPKQGVYQQYRRYILQKVQAASLAATDVAAEKGKSGIRRAMSGAGLGRLGQGIGSTSDLRRNGRGHRRNEFDFSASGIVYARGSERTRGAIESYTAGAEIRPVRGRWLWVATDEIPARAGRYRMTPALYRANGFEKKIGPLVEIKGPSGAPVLIVHNVGVNAAGKKRQAKSLTKRGAPRKGQIEQKSIIAFYAIPRTARTARINVSSILADVQAQLPSLFNQAIAGG